MFPCICISKLFQYGWFLFNINPRQRDLRPIISLRIKRRVNVYQIDFSAERGQSCLSITSKQGLHRQEIIAIDEAVHPTVAIASRHVEGIGYLGRTALEQSAHVLTRQHQLVGLQTNLRATTQPLQYLGSLTPALAHDAGQLFNQ